MNRDFCIIVDKPQIFEGKFLEVINVPQLLSKTVTMRSKASFLVDILGLLRYFGSLFIFGAMRKVSKVIDCWSTRKRVSITIS